jgi:hypothetical protein
MSAWATENVVHDGYELVWVMRLDAIVGLRELPAVRWQQ